MDAQLLVYALPGTLFVGGYLAFSRRHRPPPTLLQETRRAEPPSLHPLIDATRCIGCGSCAAACPERGVIGLVQGRAELVDPAHCIGHGACARACPMEAITLVFGTLRRGVEIPQVGPDFQTNVPGIFIAGELGGMGLIRNAVEQGRRAVEAMAKLEGMGRGDRLDLVIVGAGPAGLAASLTALDRGLRYVTLEQESLGGTIAHYPRGKVVMTAPAHLPRIGRFPFTETTKERLMAYWEEAVARSGVEVRCQERVERVLPEGDGFLVQSSRGQYRCRAVLLAIGRRGTPRRLGAAGEDQAKVVYRLADPGEYRGRRVLVVGGGDSALEAALAVAAEPATEVTLSYRGEGFNRIKEKNRQRLAEAAGRVRLLLKSEVRRIEPQSVTLEQEGRTLELANDGVIVCAGGVLPTAFLKEMGIAVETKYGTA